MLQFDNVQILYIYYSDFNIYCLFNDCCQPKEKKLRKTKVIHPKSRQAAQLSKAAFHKNRVEKFVFYGNSYYSAV